MSFNEQFDQHGIWRREFAFRLKRLAQWMKNHDLLNAAVEERLHGLESQVRSGKVMVAFVAEFSRGKSELINAIFFAGYGRRIMPASAGRTTMCPTELGYDADIAPCLRLLPIETRLQPQALMEWRLASEKWLQIDLDVNDPAQLAQVLQKVTEVQHVSRDDARALGFWHDSNPADNPPVGADGLIEVPRWRHALINIAHPLLKQGLVILDTPGLNAIGAEPELTVSLIPQAHAVVFILAADTGATKSDLSIWREHLITGGDACENRLVVLNKIDTLWDALSTAEQIQAQIDRQRATSAELLGLPLSQVIPVSAQKGLVAKVTGDQALLQASQLSALEQALGQGVMVHLSLLGDIVNLLSIPALKGDLTELTMALKQSGIKRHLKKTYGQTFSRLREGLQKAQQLTGEIHSMLDSSFRQINAEFGFSLQSPPAPDMTRYVQDLDLIERSHLQYLGLGNVIRLAQAEFCGRLVRALSNRLRVVFESALGEVELWNKSASSQFDAQLREQRRYFARRLEAIERIQQAASGLDERIAEMNAQETRLEELEAKLAELTSRLLGLWPLPFASQEAAAGPADLALAEPA